MVLLPCCSPHRMFLDWDLRISDVANPMLTSLSNDSLVHFCQRKLKPHSPFCHGWFGSNSCGFGRNCVWPQWGLSHLFKRAENIVLFPVLTFDIEVCNSSLVIIVIIVINIYSRSNTFGCVLYHCLCLAWAITSFFFSSRKDVGQI